jgi:glycosyltransferase involved in cell wall biosynthesis
VIAYLSNQYPKVSHAFIRREIRALEAHGVPVRRYSIRPCPDRLVDPADVEEKARTRVVLTSGAASRIVRAMVAALLADPARWLRTLWWALRIGVRSESGPVRHLIYFSEACLLAQWLREDGCTHLHSHFGTNGTTVAMLCRALGGPPYSFTVHGPEEFDNVGGLTLTAKIEHAAFVIAISHFGRSQLIRWCGDEHWSKIHVVRCALDATFLAPADEPAPANDRLVCVGRLCPQKGQLLLVEALGRLAAEGVAFRMVFVGDGELRGAVEEAIRNHGIEDRCEITGWASGDEVRRQLLDSRALVLPSSAEGLPVVLMEALALARPALTTHVAGIPELVESGESGWLVPSGSLDGLCHALREALSATPETLHEMGRAGAVRARSQHDAMVEAAKLVRLFPAESNEMPRVDGDPSATPRRARNFTADPKRESA